VIEFYRDLNQHPRGVAENDNQKPAFNTSGKDESYLHYIFVCIYIYVCVCSDLSEITFYRPL
jgi:hypothetical protein